MVVATGFFDGVHRGHRVVLEDLKRYAEHANEKSAVVSFWPHPRTVLQQDVKYFRLLNTIEEKKELIKSIGIDEFHTIPFTKEFSRLTTEEFVKRYLKEEFGATTLVLGYDHRLGSNESQTQEDIVKICASNGIKTVMGKEFTFMNKAVSSTIIRRTLERGDIAEATNLLGYNYPMTGVVVVGNMLGRKMGFPTANMQLYDPLKLVPRDGVYAVWAYVNQKRYMGVTNIGLRPTVTDGIIRTIETHILDFNEDIYGLPFTIEFVEAIRNERKFSNVDELIYQVGKDKYCARKILR